MNYLYHIYNYFVHEQIESHDIDATEYYITYYDSNDVYKTFYEINDIYKTYHDDSDHDV